MSFLTCEEQTCPIKPSDSFGLHARTSLFLYLHIKCADKLTKLLYDDVLARKSIVSTTIKRRVYSC